MILADGRVHDGRGGRFSGLRIEDGVVAELFAETPSAADVVLSGAVVLPGLIDTHLHLVAIGQAATMADLREVSTLDSVAERVLACSPDHTGTRFGRHFDPKLAPVDPQWFRHYFGDSRVVLLAPDLHSAWVSPRVFRDAGVSAATADPIGGRYLRNPDGTLSGFVLDGALDRVGSRFAVDDPDRVESFLRAGRAACVDAGLHGGHEKATTVALWRSLQALDRAGALPIRVTCYGFGDWSDWATEDLSHASSRLCFGGFKVFMDGALGSRGALLQAPYSDVDADAPDPAGLSLMDDGALHAWWRRADERGVQLAVHAIGDEAVRRVLALPHRKDAGLRIEHAQVVDPRDHPRFLGVVAAMQPHHRRDDAAFLEARLGERCAWAFPMNALARAGATVCFGSDAPVSELSPLEGMAAAREAGV
ncbi:MAG: amidohydrolase family protein, partial [Myxococcota bacterium]